MSSESLEKRDAGSARHPAHEALLAFIREQCSVQEKNSIDEHLMAGCVSCNRLYEELKQNCRTLNHLKSMSRYLSYPEMQSHKVWSHIQRGEPWTSAVTGKRKRKYQVRNQLMGNQGARTVPGIFRVTVPVAFGLLLLFMLTYTMASFGFVKLPFSFPGQPGIQSHQQPKPLTIAGHQATPSPTPMVAVTMTPSPGVTVSPSPTLPPTIIKGATLEVCPRSQPAGSFVLICGHGFKGVNKVWLETASHGGDALRAFGPFPVNSAGEFRGYVVLPFSCKNSPISVSAVNKTLQPLSLPLTVTMNSKTGCNWPWPTPNVAPGGHA